MDNSITRRIRTKLGFKAKQLSECIEWNNTHWGDLDKGGWRVLKELGSEVPTFHTSHNGHTMAVCFYIIHWPQLLEQWRISFSWHDHSLCKRSFHLPRVPLKLTGGQKHSLRQPGLSSNEHGALVQSPNPAAQPLSGGKWTSDIQLLQETEGMKAKGAKIYPNIWPFTPSKSTTRKHSPPFIFGWRHWGMRRRQKYALKKKKTPPKNLVNLMRKQGLRKLVPEWQCKPDDTCTSASNT